MEGYALCSISSLFREVRSSPPFTTAEIEAGVSPPKPPLLVVVMGVSPLHPTLHTSHSCLQNYGYARRFAPHYSLGFYGTVTSAQGGVRGETPHGLRPALRPCYRLNRKNDSFSYD